MSASAMVKYRVGVITSVSVLTRVRAPWLHVIHRHLAGQRRDTAQRAAGKPSARRERLVGDQGGHHAALAQCGVNQLPKVSLQLVKVRDAADGRSKASQGAQPFPISSPFLLRANCSDSSIAV